MRISSTFIYTSISEQSLFTAMKLQKNNSYTNKEWKNEEGTQSTDPTHGRSVLQIKCASNEKQNYAQWILQIFYVFCTCFLPELSDATCLPSGCFVILHRIDNPNHEWGFHTKYNIYNTQKLLFIHDPHTFSAGEKYFGANEDDVPTEYTTPQFGMNFSTVCLLLNGIEKKHTHINTQTN